MAGEAGGKGGEVGGEGEVEFSIFFGKRGGFDFFYKKGRGW